MGRKVRRVWKQKRHVAPAALALFATAAEQLARLRCLQVVRSIVCGRRDKDKKRNTQKIVPIWA